MGKAVARALAARGCAVAMLYRKSEEAALEAVAAGRSLGARAEAFRIDARDEKQVQEVVDEVVRRMGGLDILINMASRYKKVPFARLHSRAWTEAVDTDAMATFLLSVAAAPHMKRAGGGRIINVSDWLAVSGRPRYTGYAAYYTAKAAVTALTESLALELAPDILVNAVAPGPILPPPALSEEDNAKVIAATPLRRWGGAEELAKAILFLVETDFVTGECIRVDGGRHLY